MTADARALIYLLQSGGAEVRTMIPLSQQKTLLRTLLCDVNHRHNHSL